MSLAPTDPTVWRVQEGIKPSPATLSIAMAFNLTAEEFARFQAYIQQSGLPQSGSTPATGQTLSSSSSSQVPGHSISYPPPIPLPRPAPISQPLTQPFPVPLQATGSHSSTPLTSVQPASQPQLQGLTSAQGSPSHLASSAPITQLYQPISSQQLGHPATAPARQSPAFHPFLGGTFGLGLPTGHANQARMASSSRMVSSSSTPRQLSLPRRRPRGPAQQAPSLHRASKVTLNDCIGQDAAGTSQLRVLVKVLPDPYESKYHNLLYVFLRESVDTFLEEYSLLYRYDLPFATTIQSVIEATVRTMESSALQYGFPPVRENSRLASHKALPLQLLGLVGRGIVRQRMIQLKGMPINGQTTIRDIMDDKYSFFPTHHCFEDGRLILNMSFQPGNSAVVFLKNGRRHHCLSTRFFSEFGNDCQPTSADNTLGGESNEDTDDEVEATPTPARRPSTRPMPTSALASRPTQGSFSGAASHFLPAEIWAAPWNPPSYLSAEHTYVLDGLASSIYKAATRGSPGIRLSLEGNSMSALVEAYEDAIRKAVDDGDFTGLLAQRREFAIHRPDGSLETIGQGIEREVLFSAFTKYTQQFPAYFNPRADSWAALQTSRSGIHARFIPEARLRAVKVLGALCALLLISGICPDPFSPLLFYLIVFDFDLGSLDRDIVGEWHPELRQSLDDWLIAGPQGDTSPFWSLFCSYLNMDTGVLAGRDEASHKAYGAEILYAATIGLEPPSHPEIQSFARGFNLRCRNGFKFLDVPRGFAGGPSAFFTLLWTGAITGYDSIRELLVFSPLPAGFDTTLAATAGQEGTSINSLITSFLQETDIPCPRLFDEIKGGLSRLIELDKIETPGFRARVLAWAATGCPIADPEGRRITIGAALESDSAYAGQGVASVMAANGKISFRTCFAAVRLPAAYITQLARDTYPSVQPSGPQSFKEAFDFWFLCEVLNAIGGHTML